MSIATWFGNKKISSKITILSLGTLAVTAIVAGAGINASRQLGAKIDSITDIDVPLLDYASQNTGNFLVANVVLERALRLSGNQEVAQGVTLQTLKASFEEEVRSIEETIEKAAAVRDEHIEALDPQDAEKVNAIDAALDSVGADFRVYEQKAAGVWKAIAAGETIQPGIVSELQTTQGKLRRDLEKITQDIAAVTAEAGVQAEAIEQSAMWTLGLVTAIGLIGGLAAALWIGRMIAKPLTKAVDVVEALAKGDTLVSITANTTDEVGALAGSIEVFRQNTIRANELAEAQRKEQERQLARAERIQQITSQFETGVATMLATVASASTELTSTAQQLTATAGSATDRATNVAAASEEAAANVQTVAAAAEELTAAIREISSQVQTSSQIANQAVAEAERTNARVKNLQEAASRIGEVIKLINDIAAQTNLLALNATIEAARAGEAGRGFAVVANEVKTLADQTAKATEEIDRQISAVQTETQSAVTAIESISSIITRINEVTGTIAAAVEEQGAATQEIARNVEEASSGTQQVSSNIVGVTQSASETREAAATVESASGELSVQAESLRNEVNRFLMDVRTA